MSKPFDATTKQLLEADPQAWITYFGLPEGPIEIVDADVATVTAEADRVLRVESRESGPYLVHVEFQASYKSDMAERMLRYNVLLRYRHRLPVQSVVVLLRREADGTAMSGTLRYDGPQSGNFLHFGFQTVRIWQRAVEESLTAGLGTLPLAPLAADVSESALPNIVRRMEDRIAREAATADETATAGMLWTATYVLMGLKFAPDLIDRLLEGVQEMEESLTYQKILLKGEARGEARGEANEARALLLRLGSKRFGPPADSVRARIAAVSDVETLERLAERMLEVETWEELLRPADV